MSEKTIPIETLSPNDVISCLWNKNSAEKCRVGLADTVVFEHGVPLRWYVTGKNGEVIKKRGVDRAALSERWMRIAAQDDSPFVAILRQEAGMFKFLSSEAWSAFITGQIIDHSILSLHCFVKGGNNMVYRNKFELRDRIGRFSTSTHSFSLFGESGSHDDITVARENRFKFTEVKATALRNVMDLATNTVVRYLEMMLGIKVISLSIDYVIDTKSQLWILWTSAAKIARAANLWDYNVPGLDEGNSCDRMSWTGLGSRGRATDASFESSGSLTASRKKSPMTGGNRAGKETGAPASAADSRICSPGRAAQPTVSSRGKAVNVGYDFVGLDGNFVSSTDENILSRPEKVTVGAASSQMVSASNIVEESMMKSGARSRRGGRSNRFNVQTPFIVDHSHEAALRDGKFPNPFKCKGDYCKVIMQPTGSLISDPSMEVHTHGHFFTDNEIAILRKDKNFNQMMEFGASGPALAVISNRSIREARSERRGMKKDGKQIWDIYPLTPRGEDGKTADITDTEAEEGRYSQLEMDRDHRESFTKGMAVHYEQVRVCGVCYNVYQMLDWARGVLAKEAEEAAKELKETQQRSRGRSRQNEADRSSLNRSGTVRDRLPPIEHVTGTPTAGSQLSSPIQTQGSVVTEKSQKVTKRSWKDEVANLEDSIIATSLSQHAAAKAESFVELDTYLRGGAGELAKRKAREKDALVRSRIHNLVPNGPQGVSSLQSLATQDTAGSGTALLRAAGPAAKQRRKAASRSVPSPQRSTPPSSDIIADTSADVAQFQDRLYHGKVLLACEDSLPAREAKAILEESQFQVFMAKDGREAINLFASKANGGRKEQSDGFDCVLVQRDLPLLDAFEVTEQVRTIEKAERNKAAADAASLGRGVQPTTKRYPIICYTTATTPEDLKRYMRADMDGCVSYPVNKMSLLNTVRAAVPHHLAVLTMPDPAPAQVHRPRAYRLGMLGELEGKNDSTTQAASTISVASGGFENECAINGVVQIDADTRLPYIVLDASRNAKVIVNPKKPFFNLVVCHDLFDTAERLKIFLRPIVQRYLGMQILLFNYPGQAFTEWRDEQLLNNEYHAACLNEVLGQVGEKGTKDFDTTRPFYMMGVGYGTAVSAFYSAHYRVPNMRALLSFNGWSFVDSYLAGIMHDCMNIFQCSSSSRPDLPVYFFSRFLFSKDYLARVSVPLALNLYTAVHNPISLKGRVALCKGVLKCVDVRPMIKEIDVPVICVQSTQNSLIRPLHVEPFVQHRGGEVRSIFKVLRDSTKTCVIWMKAGHEVFQECRKQSQTLIEQILTGFFENHDIAFPAAPVVDKSSAEQGTLVSSLPWDQDRKLGRTIEDKYIDSVLGNAKKVGVEVDASNDRGTGERASSAVNKDRQGTGQRGSSPVRGASSSGDRVGSRSNSPARSVVFSSTDPQSWNDYSRAIAEGQVVGKAGDGKSKKSRKSQGQSSGKDSTKPSLVIDPTSSAFEKQDNPVYNSQSKSTVHEFPEVKEYMSWRLKRNKKRLQRLQAAARVIQTAFRSHMARRFIRNLRERKAAILIQRCFRGWLGRLAFLHQARKIWATLLIQRTWRGYVARKLYFLMRLRTAAAVNIQRMIRGYLARKFVNEVKRIRDHAASIIQAMGRRYIARRLAWKKRIQRNAATVIQRIYRGNLGRRRAATERDKYIFSRSQSQGIEFGRQMLLEHKLHATKLQSDVMLLTQEKVSVEEQVEALLEEISSFEEGVRTLEKEMHQLSKVEAEAAAYMDEESKFELREQKIRLDKEFGEMLSKIGNRKDMLMDLEAKLGTIDKSRQAKEEELRTLERKLVVLLEEQQNELEAIKRKQNIRAAMSNGAGNAANSNALVVVGGNGSGGTASAAIGAPGVGSSGPSLQEKRQAAQLMQSTETLMKFGFMSMSMTYFSSLNMIKALRTVSAQDTVMAALADVQAQRAAGALPSTVGGGGSGDATGNLGNALLSSGIPGAGAGGGAGMGKGRFLPDLKPGQFGGQEPLRVSAWSVEDVAKWLQTLSLGQYAEAFVDAAIDGEFLYDINDDDLKNTLGIEHKLHRKKILNCVHRLKVAEAQRDHRLNMLLQETGSMESPTIGADDEQREVSFGDAAGGSGAPGAAAKDWRHIDGPSVPLEELMSYVRNSKLALLKEALDYLPTKKFDKSLVQAPYVPDHGTVYVDGYERMTFHINKTDEHGNTLLSMACQNGNSKICKFLVAKGANPNHQNVAGQTPGHFAVSFKFFELSTWLFENGGNDTIENKFGLTPYDGMTPENENYGDMPAIEEGSEEAEAGADAAET